MLYSKYNEPKGIIRLFATQTALRRPTQVVPDVLAQDPKVQCMIYRHNKSEKIQESTT